MSTREPSAGASNRLFNFVERTRTGESLLRDALLPLWNDQFEVCGLVLDNWTIYAIRNDHCNPEHNFSFDIGELDGFVRAFSMNRVRGVYHTHPNNIPVPSKDDVLGQPRMQGLKNYIVTESNVVEWRIDDSGAFFAKSF